MNGVIALLLMLSPAAALAGPWPAAPVPTDARTSVIGEDMRLNRKPTRLYRAEIPLPVTAARDYYRAALGNQRVEPELPGFIVVSGPQANDVFTTVRLRPIDARRTEAFVMQSRPPQGEDGQPLMPSGSSLLSLTEARDGGRDSRLAMLTNGLGLQANVEFYVDRLRDLGLRPVQAKTHVRPGGGTRGQVVFFEGPRRTAMLVVDDYGSHRTVLLNLLSEQPR